MDLSKIKTLLEPERNIIIFVIVVAIFFLAVFFLNTNSENLKGVILGENEDTQLTKQEKIEISEGLRVEDSTLTDEEKKEISKELIKKIIR